MPLTYPLYFPFLITAFCRIAQSRGTVPPTTPSRDNGERETEREKVKKACSSFLPFPLSDSARTT